MKHEDKIKYMQIAAGICHFGFELRQLDLLVSIYDKILEKEGQTDLKSIATIECEVKEREIERIAKSNEQPQ